MVSRPVKGIWFFRPYSRTDFLSTRGLAPAHIFLAFLLRPPFPQDNTSSFIRDPLDLDLCRFLPMLIFHQSFDYLEDRSYSWPSLISLVSPFCVQTWRHDFLSRRHIFPRAFFRISPCWVRSVGLRANKTNPHDNGGLSMQVSSVSHRDKFKVGHIDTWTSSRFGWLRFQRP